MAGQDEHSKRAALLEPVCAHLLAHGLDRSSLRDLAAAAGTSDRMLLYYFRDKADLMEAALSRLAAMLRDRLEAALSPEPLDEPRLRARLIRMVLSDDAWPFLQVWLEIVARGGRGDPVFHAAGRGIGEGFIDWIAAQSGAPGDAARRETAERLLPLLDGLVLLKAVGLGESCAAAVLAQDGTGLSKA
jgi:AcrR family transcriptional regulator